MPFLQTLAGLAAVLATIGAAAWAMRRFGRALPLAGAPLVYRGGINLGPRERVVVVEIEDRWLVLGVTPGRVSALQSLPKGALAEPSRPAAAFPHILERFRRKV